MNHVVLASFSASVFTSVVEVVGAAVVVHLQGSQQDLVVLVQLEIKKDQSFSYWKIILSGI